MNFSNVVWDMLWPKDHQAFGLTCRQGGVSCSPLKNTHHEAQYYDYIDQNHVIKQITRTIPVLTEINGWVNPSWRWQMVGDEWEMWEVGVKFKAWAHVLPACGRPPSHLVTTTTMTPGTNPLKVFHSMSDDSTALEKLIITRDGQVQFYSSRV